MRILVISDTHISTIKNNLHHKILEEIKSSDICIHAGDFIEYRVFEELSQLIKVYGVRGNMDDSDIIKNLPETKILEIEEVRIGITHGKSYAIKPISIMKDIFKDKYHTIDVFVFGHSHMPVNELVEGKVYFNPGSPTDKIFAPYNSYGILEIENGSIVRRLVKIE